MLITLGVGFRERETAFDFKSCLNEYVKYVDRMDLAALASLDIAGGGATSSTTTSSVSSWSSRSSSEDEGDVTTSAAVVGVGKLSKAEEVRQ